jgi:hypothetical protein
MTDFEQLKEICRKACHERNACKPGFEAMLKAEDIGQMMQVWRENWEDLYESKYADILPQYIDDAYATFGEEMRQSGVYVNEDAGDGLLIVANPGKPIRAYGTADCYIFGVAEVTGEDNAKVHARTDEATVTLTGYSQGFFKAGRAEIRNFSKAQGFFDGDCYDAAYVILRGGTLRDHGHREIMAWGSEATVYSNTHQKIELYDGAQLLPLNNIKDKEA